MESIQEYVCQVKTKKRSKIILDEAEEQAYEYLTDITIPAIAKNMHCGANFNIKTNKDER